MAASVGCAAETDGIGVSDDDVKARPPVPAPSPEKIDYAEAALNETLLVSDEAGAVIVVRIGASSDKRVVTLPKPGRLVAGRATKGRFLVVTDGGAMVVIDADTALATSSVSVGWKGVRDLEELPDGRVILASGTGTKVREVDPKTGKSIREVDLAGRATSLGSLAVVGDRVIVQLRRGTEESPAQGAVAVLDSRTLAVSTVVELTAKDDTEPGKSVNGKRPGGPMIVDPVAKQLLVGALGENARDTGGLFRISTETWTVRGAELARRGFQGPSSFRTPDNRIFISYHTRTPVASTHVFSYRLDEAGRPTTTEQEALLDAFEEVEAMPANASRTLFALPISCPVGFCIGGAGVAFVSASKVQPPRLLASSLGLRPSLVLFRQ